MKFTQLAPVRWKTQRPGESREGFTLFALGEDGQVYKSIPNPASLDHRGWLLLNPEVIPEPPKREGVRRGLQVGEKVRVFDSSQAPFLGVIRRVYEDHPARSYDVAWPYDAPEDQQKVGRYFDRQIERYREVVNPASLNRLRGAVESVELPPQPPAPQPVLCPAGCGHPIDLHGALGFLAGCLVHVEETAYGYRYCPCRWEPASNEA
jgi:hypothetical protein